MTGAQPLPHLPDATCFKCGANDEQPQKDMVYNTDVVLWQVAYPELQRRQIDHARQKRWRLQAAHAFEGRAAPFGSLVDASGAPGVKRAQGEAAQQSTRAHILCRGPFLWRPCALRGLQQQRTC